MNNQPIVELQTQGLAENTYTSNGNIWSASNLVQWCKEKEYPVFDLPLAGIDLSYSPWTSLSNVKQIANHFKRVQSANLDYPVILDDYGYIADGWHRIVKAIRIQEMPQPDGVENDN